MADSVTGERLAELRTIAGAATQEPWVALALLRVVDELQERLDRIEALHANPELIAVHEGHGAEYRCNECRNSHHPCPTVKAARGEQS